VFGDVVVEGAREVVHNWDRIKQDEKQRESATEGIPEALPALAFAQKLQRRASAVGFDWPSTEGVLRKVREEAEELVAATDADERERELGDLLFALVALGRHLDIDAESALRRSARTFRDRFKRVESKAGDLRELPVEELQRLWDEAKAGS
jgi:MazG family protein